MFTPDCIKCVTFGRWIAWGDIFSFGMYIIESSSDLAYFFRIQVIPILVSLLPLEFIKRTQSGFWSRPLPFMYLYSVSAVTLVIGTIRCLFSFSVTFIVGVLFKKISLLFNMRSSSGRNAASYNIMRIAKSLQPDSVPASGCAKWLLHFAFGKIWWRLR